MSKKSLLFGAIASIIAINSVFADTTVTSKTYVDTTRQATIPASGTNAATPGTTVVTYTNTAGTIGERGIFNPETDFDGQNNTIAPGHEGDLVTAGIYPAVGRMYNQIREIQNNMPDFDDLPETTVTYKTCTEWLDGAAHTDQNCILWNLSDKNVYGKCHNDNDCAWLDCTNNPDGRYPSCSTSIGRCLCGGGR